MSAKFIRMCNSLHNKLKHANVSQIHGAKKGRMRYCIVHCTWKSTWRDISRQMKAESHQEHAHMVQLAITVPNYTWFTLFDHVTTKVLQ